MGRAPDNTVAVNDPAMSRYHLNFYVQNGELIAEDAGSQNGYTVNGQTVRGSVKLGPGDRIGIGSREYLVSAAGQSSPLPELRLAAGTAGVRAAGARAANARVAYKPGSESMGGRNRVLIAIVALVIVGAVALRKEELKDTRMPAGAVPATPPSEIPFERAEKFRQKGITEVQAEAKYRESLRDYYNKNYSRAILGFRETLTLNSNHEEARLHLESSEENLAKQIRDLLADIEVSLANMQYGRAKSQSMRVLTLIAEQTPSYNRVIAQETTREIAPISKTQDENLLAVPCDKYKAAELCTKAQKLLKLAREKLGDEDTLKEVR